MWISSARKTEEQADFSALKKSALNLHCAFDDRIMNVDRRVQVSELHSMSVLSVIRYTWTLRTTASEDCVIWSGPGSTRRKKQQRGRAGKTNLARLKLRSKNEAVSSLVWLLSPCLKPSNWNTEPNHVLKTSVLSPPSNRRPWSGFVGSFQCLCPRIPCLHFWSLIGLSQFQPLIPRHVPRDWRRLRLNLRMVAGCF